MTRTPRQLIDQRLADAALPPARRAMFAAMRRLVDRLDRARTRARERQTGLWEDTQCT